MSVAEKVNRLDTIPSAFIAQIQRLLPELYSYLISNLNLDLDSFGNVATTEINMLKALQAIDDYQQWILNNPDSKYIARVRAFMAQFDAQKLLNEQLLASFGQIPTAADVAYGASRRQTVALLVGDGFKTNFINQVRNAVIDSVSTSRSFVDMTAALSEVVLGNEQRDGRLLNWSKQVAHDRFAIADRTYTHTAAAAFKVEWYRYVGGLIEDSREFCVERNGNYYHRSEVESWPLLSDWSGRMPNTDEQTIFSFCGGYRCNHTLVPVSEFDVPDAKRALFDKK